MSPLEKIRINLIYLDGYLDYLAPDLKELIALFDIKKKKEIDRRMNSDTCT